VTTKTIPEHARADVICDVCGKIIHLCARAGVLVLTPHGPRGRECPGSRSIRWSRRPSPTPEAP